MNRFQAAMQALNDSQNAGKPVAIAAAREKALTEALLAMGEELGVELRPARIDGNGEIAVIAESPDPEVRSMGACGQYGETFASWLRRIPVRTGTRSGTAYILPQNGWCYANHFDVERMVRAYAGEPSGGEG